MKAQNCTWGNWAYSPGTSSVLTFIAEWQLKCLLKIKQKLYLVTIKVIRATLTAHGPEKPKIKKQKGKAQGVLGQISPWWDSTFRAVTLSSPCWDAGCGWGWQSRRVVHLCKGVYRESSVMWKDKGQSTDVGYSWKGLRCERTWKAVVSKCPPGCLNISENLLRLYSKAVCFETCNYMCVCCILSTWKKPEVLWYLLQTVCSLKNLPSFWSAITYEIRKWQIVLY